GAADSLFMRHLCSVLCARELVGQRSPAGRERVSRLLLLVAALGPGALSFAGGGRWLVGGQVLFRDGGVRRFEPSLGALDRPLIPHRLIGGQRVEQRRQLCNGSQ